MSPVSSTQFTVTSTHAGAADDSSGTCGGFGLDLAFSFVVVQAADVNVTVSGANSPITYIRREDCSTELACGTGSAPIGTRLQPGSYRLVVDSNSTSGSTFTATVTLTPAASLPGDTCLTAEPLTFFGGSASATGSLSGYASDLTSSSCGTIGPDRYYRLTLSSAGTLGASVSPVSGMIPAVYLLGPSSSCTSAFENTCDESFSGTTAAGFATGTLSAGTYYLVVKNRGSGAGSYSLSVTQGSLAVPGDTCATAQALTFSAGSALAAGSTTGATNDRSASCVSGGTTADVVYSFTATAGQVLSATVTPGTSWRPVLTITSGSSCSSAAEAVCRASSVSGGSATVTSAPLTAGTHYLWVDSAASFGTGAFSLSATLTNGTGNGDSCIAPIPLTFVSGTASASGSTTGLSNDNSSTCISNSGPDVVYSFSANAGETVTATLSPSTSFNGHLTLRGPTTLCTSASQLGCNIGSFAGSTVTLTNSLTTTGTYYLWVDGVNGSSGAYSLQVTRNSVPAGTGERCNSPLPLIFSGTSATTSGTTSTATHDHQGSCGGSGNDLVYTFTTSFTRTFTATVTPSSGYRPVLYLVSSLANCSTQPTSAVNLQCSAATTTGQSTTVSQSSLPPGTYFLVVDTFGSSSGSYSLSATLQ